jgi:hypothetical protein
VRKTRYVILDSWGNITFDYVSTDTPDFVSPPEVAL